MATPFNVWFQSVTPPAASTPPSGKALLGLYSATQSISSIQNLGTTLGVSGTLKGYSFYTTGTSWTTIGSWTVPGTLPVGGTVLLAVNMVDGSQNISQVSANLNHYETLAGSLPNGTIIRLGWEFDIGTGTGGFGHVQTQANFINAWQIIHGAMKGVNSTLLFDLCCNTGTSTLAQLETWYPGDAYVDYVGGDHYDQPGGGGNFSNFSAAVNLAALHGKPVSCGEWGLATSSTVDDPAFINLAGEMFNNPTAAATRYGFPAYTMAYQSYFNDADFGTDLRDYPNSEAAYTANFGS